MRLAYVTMILVLAIGALAGCGAEEPSASTGEQGSPAQVDSEGSEVHTSAALDASYENALPVDSQLALGTFLLEGTENAVTPGQAKTLLPLWQAIQGGTLQGEAETNAVLKQIEGAMTPEQLAAIAAMQLTREDQGTWAQSQGLSLGLSPDARATRQAAGGGTGAAGSFSDLSEEERASMRATAQAGGLSGGGGGAGGRFSDLSEEERASMRATAEAGGTAFGGRRAGPGQITFLARPLVELLAQRAAE